MESGARLPTVAEVVAASGVKESTAIYRLRRFERGQISREELFLTVREARVRGQRGKRGEGSAEWQALGISPRPERLADIRGETPLELRRRSKREEAAL